MFVVSCFWIENIFFICLSLFCDLLTLSITVLRIQIRDPGPGILCLFDPWIWDPGSGMGKKSRSGSGMNIPDHISESLETIFWLKILKFCDADPDPGFRSLWSWIRDPRWKNSDPGSGIRDKHPGSATLIYNTLNGLGVADRWEKVCGGRSAYNNRQPGLIIKLIYCKLGDFNTCFFVFFANYWHYVYFLQRLVGKPPRIECYLMFHHQ